MRIPLIKPYITQEIKKRVGEVLDSGFLTEGPVTSEFENTFRDFIGSRYAIATSSCTTGLEMALRVLDVGPGDEVILPDYTYPATANVVAIVGATAVIVDISRETMLIDYDCIIEAITDRTKVIIPVSIFGNPLDYSRLEEIRKEHGLSILEDAACSVGAEYRGKKVGNFADLSVFSFHPRKFVTTGEGGMITTSDSDWAEWLRSYKSFGKGSSPSDSNVDFTRMGTNYKMSDLLAAIGLEQMRLIDCLLQKRWEGAEVYVELLAGVEEVVLPRTTCGGIHSRQSFCVYVSNRDRVLKKKRDKGIEVQIGTYSLHLFPAFAEGRQCRWVGDLSESSYSFERCLTLPLYHEITYELQKEVVETLRCSL